MCNCLVQMTISYASQRSEVWRWYWRAWRRDFWRTHISTFLCVAFLTSWMLYSGPPRTLVAALIVAAVGAIPLVGFVLFPMMKFKPQLRKLTVDEQGIQTTIGDINSSILWQDVDAVIEEGEYLIIQKRNKNAFIVPPRAFPSSDDRTRFCVFVMAQCLAAKP